MCRCVSRAAAGPGKLCCAPGEVERVGGASAHVSHWGSSYLHVWEGFACLLSHHPHRIGYTTVCSRTDVKMKTVSDFNNKNYFKLGHSIK